MHSLKPKDTEIVVAFVGSWRKITHSLNTHAPTLNLGSQNDQTPTISTGHSRRERGFMQQMIQSSRGRRESSLITCSQWRESLKQLCETASSGSRTSLEIFAVVCECDYYIYITNEINYN